MPTIAPQPAVQTVVQRRAAPPATKQRATSPKPKPQPQRTARVTRAPHDRAPVPLAAFAPAGSPLDDGLLAAAGGALLLVCAGGLVVLASGRRLLREGLA